MDSDQRPIIKRREVGRAHSSVRPTGDAACAGSAERALQVTWSAVDAAELSPGDCARSSGTPVDLCKLCPGRVRCARPALPAEGALPRRRARPLRARPPRRGAAARWSRARPTLRSAGSRVGGGARSPARRVGVLPGATPPLAALRLYFRFRWSGRRPSGRRDGDSASSGRRGNGKFDRRASALPSFRPRSPWPSGCPRSCHPERRRWDSIPRDWAAPDGSTELEGESSARPQHHLLCSACPSLPS